MRQLSAIYVGILFIGKIKQTPTNKEKTIKKGDWVRANRIREPNRARTKGPRIAKEDTPVGVMLRCATEIDSWIISAFFLSGFILSIFSLMLHNFSYSVKCLGRNSSLNCWYSLVVIFSWGFSSLLPSSSSTLCLYLAKRSFITSFSIFGIVNDPILNPLLQTRLSSFPFLPA